MSSCFKSSLSWFHDLANFVKLRDFRSYLVLNRSYEWSQTAWHKVITALNMDFIQISTVEVNPAAHLNWIYGQGRDKRSISNMSGRKSTTNNGVRTKLLCFRHSRYGCISDMTCIHLMLPIECAMTTVSLYRVYILVHRMQIFQEKNKLNTPVSNQTTVKMCFIFLLTKKEQYF